VSGVVARAWVTPSPAAASATGEARTVRVTAKLGDEEAGVDVLVVSPGAPGRVGGGLVVASNYEEIVGVGAELGFHGKLPFLASAPLYFGGSLGVVQSVVRPAAVLDQRAIPLFGEVSWRPSVSPVVELVLGAAAGPVLSDVVERDPGDDRKLGDHVFDVAIGARRRRRLPRRLRRRRRRGPRGDGVLPRRRRGRREHGGLAVRRRPGRLLSLGLALSLRGAVT
jgi:hypothetical protein